MNQNDISSNIVLEPHQMLFEPINEIVDVNKFTYNLISKLCGSRVIDLIFHFPISVIKRSDLKNIEPNDRLTAIVKIKKHIIPFNRSSVYKILCESENRDLYLTFFNYNKYYLKKQFPENAIFTVSGKWSIFQNIIEIQHPDVVTSRNAYSFYLGTEAVYPLTARLSNNVLRYLVDSIFKKLSIIKIPEWLPSEILNSFNFKSFLESLYQIHHPKTEAELNINLYEIFSLLKNRELKILSPYAIAKIRIALDELVCNQTKFIDLKKSIKSQKSVSFDLKYAEENEKKLPFTLTDDQKNCLKDIYDDFLSVGVMNRLIQGDVGSGKTVVAYLAMLIAIQNGYQACLLAPTEILAMQHFNTIRKLSQNIFDIEVVLGANRKIRLNQVERIQQGISKFIIGTHALIEDNINFSKLGLVVIDEQHRFGVNQRLKLIQKCHCLNILSMSATPIPRTMLLGNYGDLDVSTIRNKPLNALQTITKVIKFEKGSDVSPIIKMLLDFNSQIFWICPVINENENLTDVNFRSKEISKIIGDDKVGLLHGQMKAAQKNEIFSKFLKQEIKILVSTTVIEVGVDVPSANVIVIEHAERFGLSGIHQLRGRVGRGREQGYCFLLYNPPLTQYAKKRLKLMEGISDGFKLSEEDLKLRGAGDILGLAQSGFNTLKFSDFAENEEMLELANQIAKNSDLNNASSFLHKIFKKVEGRIIA